MRPLASIAMRVGGIRKDIAGSSSLETSLALLLALPFLFAAFQLCIYSYAQAALSNAVKSGVRYAITHGVDSSNCSGPSTGCQDSSAANVVSTVQNDAGQYLSSLKSVTVTVSYPDSSCAPPSRVIVTATYMALPIFSIQALSYSMHATAGGRIVY
jgi:Flp pilus assembly protein TadG